MMTTIRSKQVKEGHRFWKILFSAKKLHISTTNAFLKESFMPAAPVLTGILKSPIQFRNLQKQFFYKRQASVHQFLQDFQLWQVHAAQPILRVMFEAFQLNFIQKPVFMIL